MREMLRAEYRVKARLWFCGSVVLWFCGSVVLWFCGSANPLPHA
ncbi:hypothetical protein JCM19237_1679 [Photobacterium aphoticum]|uniref:Uncharacterized protein n=1 Tax=Photobacterium aphoticum TaxID=754436 RepID=A0A090QW21_9GAMM|nr:hypothetical protein JCM19237_1679 [Photobacterium aphoticum]